MRHRCRTHHRRPWPCCCTRRRPTAIWPSTVWPRQRWRFFGIALVSLPALHWCHCQRQAVLVAGIAPALLSSWPLKVRPVQCWRLPALRWRFAHIALASLPALCCHRCHWHCAGIIALSCGGFCFVALAPLPSSPSRRRQHRELASAQSRSSRNTRWRHCQHRAVVFVGVAPALSPSLHGHLCPCCAGVAALVTSTLPPASRTGICPVMTQSRHVAGEAMLSRSSPSPMASSLYPASAHSDLAFDGLAKAAMAFFQRCAGVLACTLASSPASSCPCCRRCAGVVAELAFEGPASAALAFAGVALAFRPHRADVIASIVLSLSLPALCRRCRPRRAGVFALIARPSWWCSPFLRHRRTWRPCRIRCGLRPSSVFCRLTPSWQCTCLMRQSVSRPLPPSRS